MIRVPCIALFTYLLSNNTIQYNTIQYNTIQYNTIQYNTIQYNTMYDINLNGKGTTAGFPFADLPPMVCLLVEVMIRALYVDLITYQPSTMLYLVGKINIYK